MEIEFIMDESGSISSSDFVREKDFANSIIDQFVIGANAVRVGVTMFESDARLVVPLGDQEKNSLKNKISAIVSENGGTCISCGLRTGRQDIVRANRNVYRLVILTTDGAGNVEADQLGTEAAALKNVVNLVLAVGVGSGIDSGQLTTCASTPTPATPTTVYYSSSFNALKNLVSTLTDLTCQDLPANPCGGCKGFCGCKGTAQFRACICSSSCDDGDFCTDESCSPSVNSAGCVYPSRVCNDGDACTADTCSTAQSKCVYTARDIPTYCNDNNQCTTPSCDPAVGCTYVNIKCNDGDACTADSCVPASGCAYTPVAPCNLCTHLGTPVICQQSNCFRNECVPATGNCLATPIACNDNSLCTVDSCNHANGQCVFDAITCDDSSKCTDDSCAPLTGCVYTPINVPSVCDDLNACTTESCTASVGCVNTPVDCNDHDNCTDDFCNLDPLNVAVAVGGCYTLPKKCESDSFILAKLGKCYTAECNTSVTNGKQGDLVIEVSGQSGCYIKQLPNTTVDACGCCKGAECFCGNIEPPKDASFVVGGLALAAIILAVLGVVAIVALLGGKKGYDVYLKNRGNMTGANTNPLYNAQGMSGTNPMYAPNENL